MAHATTIAHLSDVHLAPIKGFGLQHLNVKRGLGLANWLLKRRNVHLRPAVDALVADLEQQPLDHIIVSGDLCNLGLPGEHAAALEWLGTVGPPDRVTVVPGNHDIYCPLWRDPGVQRWADYMASDSEGGSYLPPEGRGFPFVRIIDRVAIIGLVSAVPTAPFMAIGRLGPAQLAELGPLLDKLHRASLFRLVVIHHPPLPGQADSRRGLVDADNLSAILETHGAELVVHGHNHVDMTATRSWRNAAGDKGRTEIVGVASASVGRAYKDEPLARYNVIRITPEPGQPATWAEIEIVSRGLDAPGGQVVDLGTRRLRRRVETA